jgi:hypothetical protein
MEPVVKAPLQHEYLLTYTFYLDPIRARIVGLPDKMYDTKHVITDGSREALVSAVNDNSSGYLVLPNGMPRAGVPLKIDPAGLDGVDGEVAQNRIYVFHHMICAIRASHRLLSGSTPTVLPTGEMVDNDGKPVKVN